MYIGNEKFAKNIKAIQGLLQDSFYFQKYRTETTLSNMHRLNLSTSSSGDMCFLYYVGQVTTDTSFTKLIYEVPKNVTLLVVLDMCTDTTIIRLPKTYQCKQKAILMQSNQQFINGTIVAFTSHTKVKSTLTVQGTFTHVLVHVLRRFYLRASLKQILIDVNEELDKINPDLYMSLSTTYDIDIDKFYFGISNMS